MTKTLAFYPDSPARYGVTILKHLEGHKDAPYEVLYCTREAGQKQVRWAFFATRKAADTFAQEKR